MGVASESRKLSLQNWNDCGQRIECWRLEREDWIWSVLC